MINRHVPLTLAQAAPTEEKGRHLPTLSPVGRLVLLIAFAFTVMADPISSVAYAIEAALRQLSGNLALLLPTMALVIVVIAIVTVNYHQLVARFPDGGGSAAALPDGSIVTGNPDGTSSVQHADGSTDTYSAGGQHTGSVAASLDGGASVDAPPPAHDVGIMDATGVPPQFAGYRRGASRRRVLEPVPA